MSQTVEDFPPELFEQLMGLCDYHAYYRMNAGIDRAAKDLANPTWIDREVYAAVLLGCQHRLVLVDPRIEGAGADAVPR